VDGELQILSRGDPRRLNHDQIPVKKIEFLCQFYGFLVKIEKACRI
jgi:hypothetical protein